MATYDEPPSHYFGVPAFGVYDEANLKKALETALKADGPTVIEAMVDGSHYLETVFDWETNYLKQNVIMTPYTARSMSNTGPGYVAQTSAGKVGTTPGWVYIWQ